MKESGDDVMLSDASPASLGQGLGSPITTKLINIEGDGEVFARFIRFPSNGIVDLAERPPKADRKSTRLNSSHVLRSRMPSSA